MKGVAVNTAVERVIKCIVGIQSTLMMSDIR